MVLNDILLTTCSLKPSVPGRERRSIAQDTVVQCRLARQDRCVQSSCRRPAAGEDPQHAACRNCNPILEPRGVADAPGQLHGPFRRARSGSGGHGGAAEPGTAHVACVSMYDSHTRSRAARSMWLLLPCTCHVPLEGDSTCPPHSANLSARITKVPDRNGLIAPAPHPLHAACVCVRHPRCGLATRREPGLSRARTYAIRLT